MSRLGRLAWAYQNQQPCASGPALAALRQRPCAVRTEVFLVDRVATAYKFVGCTGGGHTCESPKERKRELFFGTLFHISCKTALPMCTLPPCMTFNWYELKLFCQQKVKNFSNTQCFHSIHLIYIGSETSWAVNNRLNMWKGNFSNFSTFQRKLTLIE